MSSQHFTPMEIDAIGEIMNISLGSSATAVSNLLDHRVDITTPTVSVVDVKDFSLGDIQPAIGVEIKYVAGLDGSNIMLLKMQDVKIIVDILMGMETPDEEFELNELTLSAVCEVMNQMMGASSTALSDFLGRVVNISTPETFDGNTAESVMAALPFKEGPVVVVRFALKIEGSLQSEFMNVMSVELAKELVSGFGLGEDEDSSHVIENSAPPSAGGKNLSQAEIEKMLAAQNAAASPAPAPSGGGGTMSQEEIERMMMGMASEPSPAPASSGGGMMSQEEIERMMAGMASTPTPTPPPAPASSGGGMMSQEEIERMMAGMASTPTPAPTPAPASSGGKMSQEEIERMMAGMASAPTPQPAPSQQAAMPQGGAMPGYYPPNPYYMPPGTQPMPYPPYYMPPAGWGQPPEAEKKAPDQKLIQTSTPSMPRLENGKELGADESHNLDLIMGVPLEIAVEIGRTRKKVSDILALSKGSLVVLDKLAGDQVDVYVNGKCIAQGDVVVIDDNFGIRITEILRRPGLEDLT